jgi:1-aminocyclopropane-1-carboxylate deaminase/D-cysteine desulfhydrase-like pyridoxal-dependent ACC family enzyme
MAERSKYNKLLKDFKTSLTPIENYKSILLKRDDKFTLGKVCGGKLRQAIYLIEQNLDKIRKDFNNTVVCSCSIKSPQSAIISEVCKKYGLKCKIVTFRTKEPNINLSIAQNNGAEIYGTNVGWTSVIDAKAKKLEGYFIKMGFSEEEVIKANINQVKNIPEDLDYLVVPVGSAMNFISILKGVKLYNKKPKEIIGVYVGKDPKPILKKYEDELPPYTLIKSQFSYGTEVNIDNFYFDPIYEAKAYKYLFENLEIKNKKVLLWVVGKRQLNYKTEVIKWLC